MTHRWMVFTLAMGCTQPEKEVDSDPDVAPPADTGSGEALPSDETLLRAAIDGTEDAANVLDQIADRGGLPVQTASGTVLFACLCGDGEWAVAGDHEGWVGEPMMRTDELSWLEVSIEEPDGSRYKFRQEDAWLADPLARRYAYDEYGEVSLVQSTAAHLERGWAAAAYGLDGRRLRVWVPDGGHFTHALYVHDGQNLFDPNVWNGSWHLDDAAAGLPLLLVGIDNTPARIDEYTHTIDVIDGTTMGGRAADYAALVKDIRSTMESRYGIAATTGVMGSSLGGLVSVAIADLQPGEWDAALSLSGTMGWGSIGTNGETMLARHVAAGVRDTVLYLDSGGGGSCVDADNDGLEDDAPDGADNYCENRQLADALADLGYTWEQDLWHWHEPGAPHSEAAWAERVSIPLAIFLGL